MDAPRPRLDKSTIVLKLATLNVRGITSELKKNNLIEDARRYKCDIITIQETKSEKVDRTINGYKLITFDTKCKHYGLGFVLSPRIKQHLLDTWSVSDRIAALRLKTTNNQGRERFITVINVYGITSPNAKEQPALRDTFYLDLQRTIDKQKGDTILISGDFNSKVGKKLDGAETCLGKFSKGNRNDNGEELINFCLKNNIFISNSAFKHKSCHITTWEGQWKDKSTGKRFPIYNQIDFVLVPNWIKQNLRDSRTFAGISTNTDHRLLITSLTLNVPPNKHHTKKEQKPRFDTCKLSNKAIKQQYQIECLENHNFSNLDTPPSEMLHRIQSSLLKAAESTLPKIESTQRKDHCPQIAFLSTQQKQLRLQIAQCDDAEKRSTLKNKRNQINHKIREQALKNANDKIDAIVEDIQSSGESSKMFKAVKFLKKGKPSTVTIHDENGHTIHNDEEKLKIIAKYFTEKYQSEDTIEPFEPISQLSTPITTTEVETAISKLNNNRAPGPDNVQAELIKYAHSLMIEEITKMFNKTFYRAEMLEIGNGSLILLPKPGKPPGPVAHLRPIVLLPALRKVLSLITLERIKDKVNEHLSHSQAGFRPCRSTADIVWTHRWLTARIEKYKEQYTILGIDMSSAFDTINRGKLIQVVKTFLDEDAVRLIRFLLSNTTLTIHSGNLSTSIPTLVGTPQGDSLSPVLFVIYLEAALRELRPKIRTPDTMSPFELEYADDVDFIFGTEEEARSKIGTISSTLKTWNLLVNEGKTEITTINKTTDTWKKTKKLGSLLDSREDIGRRKILATAAFQNMYKIWIRRHKLSEKKLLLLYNTLVLPILLYNCGTWGVPQKDLDALDAFHRRQLKQLLGIKWEEKTTNEELYARCQCGPISNTVSLARHRLLGHILRLDINTPAQRAMTTYFQKEGPKYRGRPPCNLPNTINKDLNKIIRPTHAQLDHSYSMQTLHNKLNCEKHLDSLRTLAADKTGWKELALNVATSDNWQAE